MSKSSLRTQYGLKSEYLLITKYASVLNLSSSSIEQSYKDMTRDVFAAEVNQLTTADPINKWVAENTRQNYEYYWSNQASDEHFDR